MCGREKTLTREYGLDINFLNQDCDDGGTDNYAPWKKLGGND
jgi:hypothetical protein